MTAHSVFPHLHRCLWHSLCCVGLQLLKDLAHAFPSPEACCSSEAIAVLLVGIHCCQVIKLCAIESTKILIVALRYAPLACAVKQMSENLLWIQPADTSSDHNTNCVWLSKACQARG